MPHVISLPDRVDSPFLLQTNETSSGDVEEVPRPSATLDLAASTSVAGQVANLAKPAAQPIIPTPAAPPSLGEVYSTPLVLPFHVLYVYIALVRLSGM
jgi:hypothetical protein